MDGKEIAKKVWKKTGFGILFVAACFVAMYILMEFHGDALMVGIAAALLLIAAFLFMNAVFTDKAKKWIPQEEEPEETKEAGSAGNDGEFRLKITKHMKEMETTQKELIEVLKNQNTLIQTQIENLEHEIYMLSEKQVNQTKSVIKFNKENARQLAISERETLEYVMTELKKAIKDKAGAVAEETLTELEELSGAELFEVSDLPGDDEYVVPDLPASEEIEIPEIPDDIDLSELFDIPELQDAPAEEIQIPEVPKIVPEAEEVAEAVSVVEEASEAAPVLEEKNEEAAPAVDPLAGLGADPNAMMTPEDIAKLLEAMGQ